MSLTKSKIEYLNFAWNFYTGCKHGLDVCPCADKCWARGMAHRYNKSFEPTLHPEKLLDPLHLKKPARIGVCFTGDLFGEWVNSEQYLSLKYQAKNCRDSYVWNQQLSEWVFHVCRESPQHDFIFLTKNPSGLLRWGEFPDNAWVGASVNYAVPMGMALLELSNVQAKHKWLSIEPLMGEIKIGQLSGIDWIVLGGWSGGKNSPPIGWVIEIIEAARKARIPIYLKDNLGNLSQEFKELPSSFKEIQ